MFILQNQSFLQVDRQNAFGYIELSEFFSKGCPDSSKWENVQKCDPSDWTNSMWCCVYGHALGEKAELSEVAQQVMKAKVSALEILEYVQRLSTRMAGLENERISFGAYTSDTERYKLFDQDESRTRGSVIAVSEGNFEVIEIDDDEVSSEGKMQNEIDEDGDLVMKDVMPHQTANGISKGVHEKYDICQSSDVDCFTF